MPNSRDPHRLVPSRQIKGLTNSLYENCDAWPTPDEGALDGDDLKKYQQRKHAIRLYIEGATEQTLRAECNIGRSQIYRLLTERCLEPHPDGQIYGWRGIVPNIRIKPYRRKHTVKVDDFGFGASGALTLVLEGHPDLRTRLDKRILKATKDGTLGPANKSKKSHWKWFLDELRDLGYEIRKEWPFNTETMGYSSIVRYIDSVLNTNPAEATKVIGGSNLAKKLKTGDGVDRPITKLLERVEMDAHKLDGRFCILFPQQLGGYAAKVIHRVWVIVLIEVISRAVLGYHFSLRREVNAEDILRAIKMALTQWQRKIITFGDHAYRDEAGFPSSLSSSFVGACWDQTSVDGAMAERAKSVKEVLETVVQSKLIDPSSGFSSRRSKDDRPFIETFFRQLASNGFHKISNTTGGKPGGDGGSQPEKVAETSQFQIEYAEELLDVLIANYNATPHTALGGRSPLQYLAFLEGRSDFCVRRADPESVSSIVSYRKRCKVNGGIDEGRRPYVNFVGARYSNEILAQRHDLVGTDIWVVNHLDNDARVAKASTLNGASLGVVRAHPPWHLLPHSLAVRRAIASFIRRQKLPVTGDAVETFLNYCEQQEGKRLPVHPAYLELRRILVSEAQNRQGSSVLADAITKYAENLADESEGVVPQVATSPSDRVGAARTEKLTLPARRKAASRK